MINQWDIYLANLDPVKWHEQSWLRPVLIVQNNILNKNLNTVVVAPITSNRKAEWKMTTYFLESRVSWLNKDSIALLFQIRTIDKVRLINKIWNLSNDEFILLKKQLMFVF